MLAAAHDRRRVAEELLHVVLVGVRRRLPAGLPAQAQGPDEGLHGAGAGGVVGEAGGGEAPGVDAPAVAEQVLELGGQVEEAGQRAGSSGG